MPRHRQKSMGVVAVDNRPDVVTKTCEIQVIAPAAQPTVIKEKEIVREVVMIPCKYCSSLMEQTVTVCPNCGAKRTGSTILGSPSLALLFR
jgi:hypothetical protein